MKTTNPPTPPIQPTVIPPNPEDPYQQLGSLHILKGTIILIMVKSLGVELMLANGLSIQITGGEIVPTKCRSHSQFAECLKLGASFPSLKLNVAATKDFIPRWVHDRNEGSRLRDVVEEIADSGSLSTGGGSGSTGGGSEGDSQPQDGQPAAPISLPLTPTNFPPLPGGGGRGR